MRCIRPLGARRHEDSEVELSVGTAQLIGAAERASLETLNVVRDIQAGFGLGSLLPQIRAMTRLVGGSRRVNVAVVGRFKAGKSSFLNQIIGCDVLPVDVLPATAVITEISYGRVDQATVIFEDGRKEEIDRKRLAEFVTEKENPENAREVQEVHIELSSLGDFRTVCFVDTPGLGSIYSSTTKTCLEWLPEIGAAIVALTLDPPLSEDDLELLHDLVRLTPEILILLTKVDLASAEQVETVRSFMRREIKERLGRDIPVYPYSVKPEFHSLHAKVERYLIERIAAGHEERRREIVDFKTQALVRECRDYLGLALVAAEASEQARADLLALVEREQGHLGQIHTELRLLSRDLKKRTHQALVDGYDDLYAGVLAKVRADFDAQSVTWRGNLARTSARFQEWAATCLARHLGEVLPRGEHFVTLHVAEAEAHFSRAVRAFQDRLSRAVETALAAQFSGATFAAEIQPPCAPDVRVDRTFDIPLDMMWFLVPMFLFRKLISRRLRSQMAWEVEKNLSRLAWQWTEAADSSIDAMARQAEEFITQEAATVADLASARGGQVERVKAVIARLDELAHERET